jgi:hypothetical protein
VEDDPAAGAADLTGLGVTEADAVVGIAASGRTPYVLGRASGGPGGRRCHHRVSNNPGTLLSSAVDHPIEVLTGREVVAGSTRMKAGTAQKLVLNAISTAVMVRLGKTYGNLMVDVLATNGKLRHRASGSSSKPRELRLRRWPRPSKQRTDTRRPRLSCCSPRWTPSRRGTSWTSTKEVCGQVLRAATAAS